MCGLRQGSEERSDLGLFRRQVACEPRIERNDGQLVQTNQTGDELKDEELVIETESVFGILEVFLEQLLGETLRVVEEVEGGEVEWVRRILFAILSVQPRFNVSVAFRQ